MERRNGRFTTQEQKLIYDASLFAAVAHKGQYRKYSKEGYRIPYIIHPEAVADIVLSFGGSAQMVAAAFLHDVMEDCNIHADELVIHFGSKVAQLVVELTNTSKKTDGNRKQRKALDLLRICTISPEAKTIKLADILHNLSTLFEDDPEFCKVYVAEKKQLLDVMRTGDTSLWLTVRNRISHIEAQIMKYELDKLAAKTTQSEVGRKDATFRWSENQENS